MGAFRWDISGSDSRRRIAAAMAASVCLIVLLLPAAAHAAPAQDKVALHPEVQGSVHHRRDRAEGHRALDDDTATLRVR